MRSLDDSFSYAPLGKPSVSDGGHYYRTDSSNPPEILAAHKSIDVYVADCDQYFSVTVNETVVLPERHSAGKRLRRRQRTRTAWAFVHPVNSYHTLGDAVREVVEKLRQQYLMRYGTNLIEAPLENLIILALYPND